MNRSEGLDLMANLLEQSGWAKGRFGYLGVVPTKGMDEWEPNWGYSPCCIEGADHRAQMILFRVPYPPVKFLPAPPEGFEGWSQWNDAPGRTQQQIIDCLRNLAPAERIKEAGIPGAVCRALRRGTGEDEGGIRQPVNGN